MSKKMKHQQKQITVYIQIFILDVEEKYCVLQILLKAVNLVVVCSTRMLQ